MSSVIWRYVISYLITCLQYFLDILLPFCLLPTTILAHLLTGVSIHFLCIYSKHFNFIFLVLFVIEVTLTFSQITSFLICSFVLCIHPLQRSHIRYMHLLNTRFLNWLASTLPIQQGQTHRRFIELTFKFRWYFLSQMTLKASLQFHPSRSNAMCNIIGDVPTILNNRPKIFKTFFLQNHLRSKPYFYTCFIYRDNKFVL